MREIQKGHATYDPFAHNFSILCNLQFYNLKKKSITQKTQQLTFSCWSLWLSTASNTMPCSTTCSANLSTRCWSNAASLPVHSINTLTSPGIPLVRWFSVEKKKEKEKKKKKKKRGKWVKILDKNLLLSQEQYNIFRNKRVCRTVKAAKRRKWRFWQDAGLDAVKCRKPNAQVRKKKWHNQTCCLFHSRARMQKVTLRLQEKKTKSCNFKQAPYPCSKCGWARPSAAMELRSMNSNAVRLSPRMLRAAVSRGCTWLKAPSCCLSGGISVNKYAAKEKSLTAQTTRICKS